MIDYSHLPVLQTLYDHYDKNTWCLIDASEMLRLLKGFCALRQKGAISIYAQLPSPFGDRLRTFSLLDPSYYIKVKQILFCHNTKKEFKHYTGDWAWVVGEDYLTSSTKDMDFSNREII